MKSILPLLAILICALPVFSQLTEVKTTKFERKAEKLASKDKDYASLTDDEKTFLIKAIATKMAKIDAENRHSGKYKEKVDGVDIRVILANSDLDEVKKKHPELALKEKRGEVIREKQWGDPGTPDKKIEQAPSFTVDTIPSPDFHSLFSDNDWVVDENSCDAGYLSSIVDQAAESAGKDGKIEHISIESSASRYKNTGKAADKSFKQLSQLRAEGARDFIIKKLAEKGKIVSVEDVDIDADGANKDGTSGPDPDPKHPEKKADYDQYKFVHVSMYVSKLDEKQNPPVVVPGKPADEHAEVVTFGLDTEERCKFLRCITLPSIRINRHVSRRNWGSTKCPRF